MMKNRLTFLIIGIILGIICTLFIIKIRQSEYESPERKKDAIVYAQNLIRKEFGKEKKYFRDSYNGVLEDPYYVGIEFPPVSKTKVEITELKTYIVEFYANYHTERCVRYYPEQNGCTMREGDSFYVELEYKDSNWNEIDSRRISR